MVKRLLKIAATLFLFAILCGSASAQVIVNEVMANEPGGNVMLEWVELYNNTEETVFLGLYTLSIASDTLLLPGSFLYPYEYAVFCRKLYGDLSSDGFEDVWGDGSGFWGDNSVSEDYLIFELSGLSLTNASGTVALQRATQEISSLSWGEEGEDGVSWERSLPADPDGRQSTDPTGSTPGKVNSITPLEFDLALLPIETTFLGAGVTQFLITVVNFGLRDMPAGEISLSYDLDMDSVASSEDLIAIIEYPQTEPGDTVIFLAFFELEGVQPIILVELPPDFRNSNNKQLVPTFGSGYPPVLISEFLADPQDELTTEWVELKNRSDDPIDLQEWHLGDEIKFYPIARSEPVPDMSIIIEAGDYIVLCKDITAFEDYYGTGIDVIEMNSWPALNNGGDIIRLRDNLDNAVDSFQYDFAYGANYTWGRGEESGMTNRWGRSVDPGGTPGALNEIYFQAVSASISVTAEPNPFSPNRDGLMEIDFEVPPGENMTIKIYDTRGRVVKTLMDNLPAFEGRIEWDGRSDGGRALNAGMYILYVEVAEVESYKQTIVIAP